MRVLLVNTERGWRGGENQVLLLARGLGANEAVTACQPGSELEKALVKAGLPALPVAMRGPWHLGAALALRRAMREQRLDLFHAQTSHAHSLGLIATWGTGLPLVVTRRVDFAVGGGWLGRWKYRRVARFAAVSAPVREVLVTGGVDAERIAVIHDGIDFDRFAGANRERARAGLGLPPEAVVVGVVASLTPDKDHRTLLDAFAEVARQQPLARLLVVGSGPLEAELRQQAGDSKAVIFTGFRDDVPDLLAGMDAFVLASRHEGLGSSLMDAMYCGLPVVATRAGGIPELVADGENGLLVPVGDPRALAMALGRVCADAGLRSKLGEAGRRTARASFGFAAMVDGYRALYRDVLAAR